VTLELNGQKVFVSGEKQELVRNMTEAGADGEADVVIWIREWKGDLDEFKRLLLKMEAQVVTNQPNGTSSHASLWREAARAQKSYW
jgi:hypothetical protein